MPSGSDIAVWAGILTTLALAVSSLVVGLSSRKKNNADAAAVLSTATVGLLEPLNARIATLASEMASLKTRVQTLTNQNISQAAQIADLTQGVGILIGQLEKAGIKPEYHLGNK